MGKQEESRAGDVLSIITFPFVTGLFPFLGHAKQIASDWIGNPYSEIERYTDTAIVVQPCLGWVAMLHVGKILKWAR